jgi:hypothetical protein
VSPLDRQLIANQPERSSARLDTVSDVHQCPYCELRFATRNEVEDHVAVDHPRPVEDDSLPAPGDDQHVTRRG